MCILTKNLMRQGLGAFTGLTLALGLTAPLSVNATVIEFRQDLDIRVNGSTTGMTYSRTHDVEIRGESPDTNFDLGTGSGDPEFTVDGSDPNGVVYDAHVLMRFDDIFGSNAWQIPVGSIIYSATLFLDFDNTGDDISLLRMNIDWGTETTATWNTLVDGIDGTEGSLVTVLSGSLNKELIDVTPQLASWSSGAGNFGWGFVPTTDDLNFDGVDFDASENSDPTDRPMLTVEFGAPVTYPVPEPGTLALLVLGLSGIRITRRK